MRIEAPTTGIPYAVYMPSVPSTEAVYCPTTAENPKAIQCAFPKKVRDWWMAVGNFQCQTFLYTERGGWGICGLPADEVDHILPESWLIAQGIEDPNGTVGIPRCRGHHSGYGLDKNGEVIPYGIFGWTKHPDMGQARREYHPDINPDSFKNTAHEHYEKAKRGERFWNTTEEVDEMERAHMIQLVQDFLLQYPDSEKPEYRPHPHFHKKKWWHFL